MSDQAAPPQRSEEAPLTGQDAVSALFEGLSLSFSEPTVRRPVMVALLANGVIFTALLAGVLWCTWDLTADWVTVAGEGEGGWLDAALGWLWPILGWLIRCAVTLLALVCAPVAFKLIAALVLPVFNDAVFERARAAAGGGASDDAARLSTLSSLGVDLRRVCRFVVWIVTISVVTMMLSWVPLVGLVAAPLGLCASLWVGALTLGWDFHAFHLERRGLDYAAQRAYVVSHRPRILRVGFVAMLLLMVPLVQVLFLTTNVAGSGVFSAWLSGAPRG